MRPINPNPPLGRDQLIVRGVPVDGAPAPVRVEAEVSLGSDQRKLLEAIHF